MLLISAIVQPKSNEFATQQPSRSSNGRTRRRLKQTRIERSVLFSMPFVSKNLFEPNLWPVEKRSFVKAN